MNLNKIAIKEAHYQKVLEIWETSVNATHHFLKLEDKEEIKKEIPFYLSQVEAYLWYDEKEIIGFSGTHEENLEMLFIDPKQFRNGYGSKILQTLINEGKVNTVAVNKDNTNAVIFYNKNGFKKYKELAKDHQGRDYPILQLKL
jgi:putative acetyltransferase